MKLSLHEEFSLESGKTVGVKLEVSFLKDAGAHPQDDHWKIDDIEYTVDRLLTEPEAKQVDFLVSKKVYDFAFDWSGE